MKWLRFKSIARRSQVRILIFTFCDTDYLLEPFRVANLSGVGAKLHSSVQRSGDRLTVCHPCWETSSTSATSAEEAEDRIGSDRSMRPSTSTNTQTGTKEGRFGAKTGRPLGKIFRREYILGVSVELFNEHWSTVSPSRTCIKVFIEHTRCIEIEHIF